jgi:hypothetical protein
MDQYPGSQASKFIFEKLENIIFSREAEGPLLKDESFLKV